MKTYFEYSIMTGLNYYTGPKVEAPVVNRRVRRKKPARKFNNRDTWPRK